jgi:hypothetical protein
VNNEQSGDGNINITTNVNVPQPSRGAGTVLMLVFFGWVLLFFWWPLLASIWVVWLVIAAIVTIWDHEFFVNNWYYPWPAWMLGIR